MTGRGLVDFGRWGKLGEKEKEKGKSWERGPVFGLLLADGGESEVASGEDNTTSLSSPFVNSATRIGLTTALPLTLPPSSPAFPSPPLLEPTSPLRKELRAERGGEEGRPGNDGDGEVARG
ncbi:hypothetical protein NC652_010354 [Populus alba x Populus x berolinensis]|nr:hypothetical protein NC652_010354 [Populus alba x Populus x berolinensis]